MGRQGLPPQARIRKAADFERVRREGKYSPGPLLGVAAYDRGEGRSRLGLAVSGRVGGAVVRNTIKRRLREAFRRNQGAILPGWDVVLVARPKAAAATFQALQENIFAGLARAGALRRKEKP